jgi:phosphoribosyl-dephospho-CoA transferase
MAKLRRHQLAYLSQAGWAGVLDRHWDEEARDCLLHWAARQLPLVVTQQPAEACESGAAGGLVALGLQASARWGRRRLALRVPHIAVSYFDEFPRLMSVLALLPRPAREPVQGLMAGLADCGATARVYGSYGWQALSRLVHVKPSSDLDLWVGVNDAGHADQVARCLAAFADDSLRLDGELMFDDGTAVAWREWGAWRAGRARAVMVRRIGGVALMRDDVWCASFEQPALAA